MFFFNLKLILRNILKQKGSFLLNALGLTLALTVCLLTAYYALFVHNTIKREHTTNEIYLVLTQDGFWDWPDKDISLALSDFLRNDVPGIENVINYEATDNFNIEITPDKIFKESHFHFIDSNFFKYHKYTLLTGSIQLTHKSDVLLTRDIALKYFGTLNCVGESLRVYGHQSKVYNFKVSGVFDYPAPSQTSPKFNLISRLDVYENLHKDFLIKNGKQETEAYLVLNKEANLADIKDNIIAYCRKHRGEEWLEENSIELTTLAENSLSGSKERVKTGMIISALILIVALFNFILNNNAQFWERSKTVGVKKIVGGRSKNILWQSVLESVIVATVCIIAALFLSIILLPELKNFLDDQISFQYIQKIPLSIFLISVLVIITICTSLSSLFLTAFFSPLQLINRTLNKGQFGKRINSTLMVVQVAVFSFLMIMLLISTKQMKYMQNRDWGFNAEQLIKVPILQDGSLERYSDFKGRVNRVSGVVSASGCRHIPPSNNYFFYGSMEDGYKVEIEFNNVDFPYLKTLGLKLKSGRDFDPKIDKPGEGKLIVNQEFLDLREIKNPYDTLIKVSNWVGYESIIGVLEDYHMRNLRWELKPLIMRVSPEQSSNMLIKITANDVMETLNNIENEFHQVYPNMAYQMSFIKDDIQKLYVSQLRNNRLVKYYTVLSILIACLGLFGFVMNEMNKRIKEIGIRKVNGAKAHTLAGLLNQEYLMMNVIAFILATPFAYYFANKWLQQFAFATELSWWIFVLVCFLSLTISFATISIQSWRAASKNPVEALRYE